MVHVVCIDDEPETHEYLRLLLPGNCTLKIIGDAAQLPGLAALNPDLVFLDIDFAKGLGRKLLQQLHAGLHPVPIIILTHSNDPTDVMRSVRDGAADFLVKPISRQKLLLKLSIAQAGGGASAYPDELALAFGPGSGKRRFEKVAAGFSQSGACCLVAGARGSGIFTVARELHAWAFGALGPEGVRDRFLVWSPRGRSAENQAEELFGRPGKARLPCVLERLDGGTLCLEHLSEMAPAVRESLLSCFRRKSGAYREQRTEYPVRFRLVLIQEAGGAGVTALEESWSFLEPLRSVGHITVPSLADRRAELPALAWHFALSKDPMTGCRQRRRIGHAAMEKILDYQWPGDLAELQHTIRTACARTRREELQPEDLVIEHNQVFISGRGNHGL